MIFKTASPISPDVEIAVDNTPINYMSLQRISLEEKENAHGAMVLDFSGLDPSHLTDYADKPIRVSIEFPNLGGTEFLGYVVFVEPMSVTKDGLVNQSPFQITRFYCLGASYVMRSKVSRAWKDVTLGDIAQTIALKYNFALSVPNDDFRFSHMVQSGESDWAFLVKCANYLGYSVAMEKTMLHIWDPHKALGHKKSFAVLKTIAGTSGNVTPNVGQVLRFDGRIGKVTTSAERTQERIHMVSTDGQLLTVESSLEDTTSGLGMPVTSQFDHTVAINTTDYEMARKVLEGNLRRAFPFTAVVDITGDPTIKPGGVVYLSKYNSNFDGYWYVRSVRHEITRSELVSILELAKDGTNETDYTINPVVQYSQPPASALLNQQWLAEREYINIYE